MDWELIQTFCSLMRGGGLKAASVRLGVSPATVSRRLRKLEALVEDTLFSRSGAGYRPTEAAIELYDNVREMDVAATRIQQSLRALSGTSPNVVRVSAGNWLSRLIALEIGSIQKRHPDIQIEVLNSFASVSLAADDADIAIRNTRPSSGHYFCRKYPTRPYAVYSSQDFLRDNPSSKDQSCWPNIPWVGFVEGVGNSPSNNWISQRIGRSPDIRCNQSTNILDAVIGSAGLGLIPCFVAKETAQLSRLSESTNLNIEGIWAIAHEKVRNRPAVRLVLNELSELLSNNPP